MAGLKTGKSILSILTPFQPRALTSDLYQVSLAMAFQVTPVHQLF